MAQFIGSDSTDLYVVISEVEDETMCHTSGARLNLKKVVPQKRKAENEGTSQTQKRRKDNSSLSVAVSATASYVVISEAEITAVEKVSEAGPHKRKAENEGASQPRKRRKDNSSLSVAVSSAACCVVVSEAEITAAEKVSEAVVTVRTNLKAEIPRNVSQTTLSLKSKKDEYKTLNLLGKGCFGEVVKCWNKKTQDFAAMKITKEADFIEESRIWTQLTKLNTENVPIVKVLDLFQHSSKGFMVFELLDQSLYDFMKRNSVPIEGVRRISTDLLSALAKLKEIGIIHTDIKMDNIMLVDHMEKPYSVKLIDFGLAIDKKEGHFRKKVQSLHYRAPEVLLRLPYNEAIDMWAVGCVIGAVLTRSRLFPGKSEYDMIRLIHETQGIPPLRMLNCSLRAIRFFGRMRNSCNGTIRYKWRLKTPDEYYRCIGQETWEMSENPVKKLEDVVEVNFNATVKDGVRTSEDRHLRNLCTDLLKKMLIVDPEKRISAYDAAKHLFVSSRLFDAGEIQDVKISRNFLRTKLSVFL